MKIHKTYIAIGMIIALALFLELAAHADDVHQATEITFHQPVGDEFVYSKQLEKAIAQDRQQTVVAHQGPITGSEAGGSD